MLSEKASYHSLNLATQSNYRLLSRLKGEFGTWSNAWQNFANSVKTAEPNQDLEKLNALSIQLILFDEKEYPNLLREIPWPPLGIYVLGTLKNFDQSSLAIVGTRKASEDGKELAKYFGYSLSKSGFNIVSGLALGIDTAAHIGSLDASGQTVAVLGNGLDQIYPKINKKLAERIIKSGNTIISEYPPGMPSLPHHFIERNRIISGLSKGILVIEAPENSGALSTARFALDQNREVFVIPGPIRHPNFRGSNELIRQGATLVTKSEHILEILSPESLKEKMGKNVFSFAQNQEESLILNTLSHSRQAVDIDKIIELTKLDAQTANRALSFLIIKNIVKETESGYTLY